jgi:hypothetical protein
MSQGSEVDYIRQHHLEGALYNEIMTDGSFHVYAPRPAVRPVMDARVDFVGGSRYLEYDATHASTATLVAYLRRDDIPLGS